MTGKKTVLHVGCGYYKPSKLHKAFHGPEWKEIRLDIDPKVKPDIIGDIRSMNKIESNTVDAVYSSHNIEHLYHHEVKQTLAEFLRILRPNGFVIITCPDLQSVAERIVTGDLDEALYLSPAGPVAPIDILYGYRPSLANGNFYMAHKTGFTAQSLGQCLIKAGFVKTTVKKDKDHFALWAIAYKQPDDLTP